MGKRGPFRSWTVWAKGYPTEVRYSTERAALTTANELAEMGYKVKVIERTHADLEDQLGTVVQTTPVYRPPRRS